MSMEHFLTGASGTKLDFSGNHSRILQTPYQTRDIVYDYPGVVGEGHVTGETLGRFVACNYSFTNASESAMVSALESLQAAIGKYHGSLVINGGVSYVKCTFIGYEETRRFYDASGVNGYVSFGILRWRQRSRS